MTRRLTVPAAFLIALLSAPSAALTVDHDPATSIRAFAARIVSAPPQTSHQFTAIIPAGASRGGERKALLLVDAHAGRLDNTRCFYHLQVGYAQDESGPVEFASRVKPVSDWSANHMRAAPCASLADELQRLVAFEAGAFTRHFVHGGAMPSRAEREQVASSARREPRAQVVDEPSLEPDQPGTRYTAVSPPSRVNVRASPALNAPVLSRLGPQTSLRLLPSAVKGWYQVEGSEGYVHHSAIRQLRRVDTEAMLAGRSAS